MSTITGYKEDTYGVYIPKDPQARLVYTMDWSEWLAEGQTLISVDYAVTARANDSTPVTIVSQGLSNNNTHTYVELESGTLNKVYTVTATITTDDSSQDRRNFRVKIENRSA
jgi:hypothetical protein